MIEDSPYALPKLKEVFRALRGGRHLCFEDGDLFQALHRNRDSFEDLFSRLGFRLEAHSRDFYYFRGEDRLSEAGSRLTVFMFVLIEWLVDQGARVEDTLMTRHFALDDLPHFSVERYQRYMAEAGMRKEDGESVLRSLERLGFVERLARSEFRFRTPVYRFLDLCQRLVAEENEGAGA